jgi:hypothetical protein
MDSIKPAANVGWAAVVTTLVVALLQILQANGIHVPDSVMASVPPAVPVLVAYFHDLKTGQNQPKAN